MTCGVAQKTLVIDEVNTRVWLSELRRTGEKERGRESFLLLRISERQ